MTTVNRFGGKVIAEDGFKAVPGATAALLVAANSPYVLSEDDSGGTFLADADGAVDITLPTPIGNPGMFFRFVISDAGAGAPADNVTINDGGAGALFIGTIVDVDAAGPPGVPRVIPASGTILTFLGGTSALGDNIEVFSAGGLWTVKAVSTANGGITITP